MDKEDFDKRDDDWVEPLRVGIRNKFLSLDLDFHQAIAFFSSSIIEYMDVGEYSVEEAEKILDFLKIRAIEFLKKKKRK